MISPFTNQETDRLNKLIEESKKGTTDFIREYISKHNASKYQEGVDYYFKKNDIMKRNIYAYDAEGNKHIDMDATNNKAASGWHKLLVDQKVSYLTGEPVTLNSEDDDDATDSINEVLGHKFNDMLPTLVKNASNKGVEWLHPYVDEQGNFDYIIIPAQEGIPIYENTKRNDLIGFIRKYKLDLDEEIEKVELWDAETVTYYEYVNGQLYPDYSFGDEHVQSHFYYKNDGYGWGSVPFVAFDNNDERVSDLTFTKDYIDIYDNLFADTANTLEDIQQILYEIRGYEGTSASEALANIKRYKVVLVDGEKSGVDMKQGEMPMSSMDSYLDRLSKNLYTFGGGVDFDTDKFGNSPSGVALQFLFSNLDMRASVAERKFTRAIQEFLWFVCEYLSIAENKEIDYKEITITFNKTIVSNQLEKVTMAQQSMGIVSKETLLENHPFVTDVEAEKQQLEDEQEQYVMLDDEGEEDEQETTPSD